ncbi:MAG: NAD+ synthase [Solirubrobacterales bacterium]
MSSLRIALAQVNPTVGDIDGNVELVRDWIRRAEASAAQLILFPELVITGYPPEDLMLKPHFVAASEAAVAELAADVTEPVVIVGYAASKPETSNAMAVIAGGEIRGSYRKNLLPNYGVFDERRYFDAGTGPALAEVAELPVGLTICEDIWFPGPPATLEADAGARLIVNISASPYQAGKGVVREEMVATRAQEVGVPIALCNMVGGQDELVFDGHSVVVDEAGATLARAGQFEEELLVCDLELDAGERDDEIPTGSERGPLSVELLRTGSNPPAPTKRAEQQIAELLGPEAEVYAALTLGLRDYVEKNRFERVVLALSGGIDSALVALLAVDALGPDRVTTIVMPSPNSSEETQADARAIAGNLGAQLIEVPIAATMGAYDTLLEHPYAEGRAVTDSAPPRAGAPDVATENVQARIRGNVVMALSNRFGWLPLTTGNKSELSVGYATLYGDMAGGFAVIKDVSKTLVYKLVRTRNEQAGRELVPSSVLERAPSAELRPDQRDEDSLPPYELLDQILEAYVEEDHGRAEMVAEGLDPDTVDEVIALVDRAEYKRRQAPPGVKISPKAFGRDRRLPITNRFRG